MLDTTKLTSRFLCGDDSLVGESVTISVKMMEKRYLPWVQSRQRQLTASVAISERPSDVWAGAKVLFSVETSDLRRELFKMTSGDNASTA